MLDTLPDLGVDFRILSISSQLIAVGAKRCSAGHYLEFFLYSLSDEMHSRCGFSTEFPTESFGATTLLLQFTPDIELRSNLAI